MLYDRILIKSVTFLKERPVIPIKLRAAMSKEPIGKVERWFWKLVYRFVDKHSDLGRAIRSRLVKRSEWSLPFLNPLLTHACVVFDYFDPQIDCLFLGSSHTMRGFAPTAWKKLRAWNAGFSNGDLKMSYMTYLTLRNRWSRGVSMRCLER